MSAYLLGLLLQPMPPMPPAPPPIVRIPAPITVAPVPIAPSIRNESPIPVQVRVTAGNLVLFNDRLTVDSYQGASFSQSRSEASPAACPKTDRFDRQQGTYFNLRLNRRMGVEEASLSVAVTWTRPIEGDQCGGSGTRGATLNQVVGLDRGKTTVVTGDGGLRVEITPR